MLSKKKDKKYREICIMNKKALQRLTVMAINDRIATVNLTNKVHAVVVNTHNFVTRIKFDQIKLNDLAKHNSQYIANKKIQLFNKKIDNLEKRGKYSYVV